MHIVTVKLGQADAGDNEAKLMTKLAPEWVRTNDPVIRSPARYRWTTAHAPKSPERDDVVICKVRMRDSMSVHVCMNVIYMVSYVMNRECAIRTIPLQCLH